MNKKFVLVNTLVTAVVLSLFFLTGLLLFNAYNYSVAKNNVINATNVYASNYSVDLNLSGVSGTDYRVTIIDYDGVVLADSTNSIVSSFENHSDREEIVSAKSGTPTAVERYSDTLRTTYIYYAVEKTIGSEVVFIRLAVAVDTVTSYIGTILPILLIVFIVLVLAGVLLSYYLNKRLLSPLNDISTNLQAVNDGTYKKASLHSDSHEFNKIYSKINDISLKLQANMSELKVESRKLKLIINNVNDVIFAVDSNSHIIMLNEPCNKIFNVDSCLVGKHINSLTDSLELPKLVGECLQTGTDITAELKIDSKHFAVFIKSISTKWHTSRDTEMCLVILTDITENKNNEQIRSEFFENASHELKTPLTAVNGFIELLENNPTKDKQKKYIGVIKKESERMMTLIEDMLKLSMLEQNVEVEKVVVGIDCVAQEVLETLSVAIAEKNIATNITGKAEVNANTGHIYELLKNIMENAVKYNKDGGSLAVELSTNKTHANIVVKDSGIGIDASDQGRLFERFYRVEKSRSRKQGGTGLGLSIVKHICNIYKADIKLYSKVGQGTRIEINFPL